MGNKQPRTPNPLHGQPVHQASPTEMMSLQALMDIKESIGEIKSDIKNLNDRTKTLETNLGEVKTSLSNEITNSITEVKNSVNDIESKISFLKGVKWTIFFIVIVITSAVTFALSSTFYLGKIQQKSASAPSVPTTKNIP